MSVEFRANQFVRDGSTSGIFIGAVCKNTPIFIDKKERVRTRVWGETQADGSVKAPCNGVLLRTNLDSRKGMLAFVPTRDLMARVNPPRAFAVGRAVGEWALGDEESAGEHDGGGYRHVLLGLHPHWGRAGAGEPQHRVYRRGRCPRLASSHFQVCVQ